MMFQQNLLQFSSLSLVYGSYEQVAILGAMEGRFLTAAGDYRKWWSINKIDYNFHHRAWYMSYTSKWPFHTKLATRLWHLHCHIATMPFWHDPLVIFIIELGIWVIWESGKSLRVTTIVLHGITWYCTVTIGFVCCCIVLHSIVLNGIVWYCVAQHFMVWHGIALYCFALHGFV